MSVQRWKRWLAALVIAAAAVSVAGCDDTEFDFPTPEFDG